MDRRSLDYDPGAAIRTRLTRLRYCKLLTAAVGAVLALGLPRDMTAARCRKKSARCSRKEQCCSKRCKRGFCYPRRR